MDMLALNYIEVIASYTCDYFENLYHHQIKFAWYFGNLEHVYVKCQWVCYEFLTQNSSNEKYVDLTGF